MEKTIGRYIAAAIIQHLASDLNLDDRPNFGINFFSSDTSTEHITYFRYLLLKKLYSIQLHLCITQEFKTARSLALVIRDISNHRLSHFTYLIRKLELDGDKCRDILKYHALADSVPIMSYEQDLCRPYT